MKLRSSYVAAIAGAAVAIAIGAGFFFGSRGGEPTPVFDVAKSDLQSWPEPFRRRLTELEARLDDDAGDVAALGELARFYHANGFLRPAEHAYRRLVRLEPENARWPHLLGSLLAGYGRLNEAAQWAEQAVQRAPEYVPARLRWADALLKASRWAEAETVYRAVAERAPDNPYAWLGLARVELATGRLTAAREKLTRAVAVDADFFAAHSLLASLFERLGNDEGAAMAKARASQAGRFREAPDPWLNDVMDHCYDVYRLQVAAASAKITNDLPRAITLLERAIEFAPADARNHRQLGLCWLDARDVVRARDALERAVSLAPDEAANYLDLSQALMAGGAIDAALETLATGLTKCADRAALHHRLGALLVAKHRTRDGLPHLEMAAALTPEKPEIACDLIPALFEVGREADAVAALTQARAAHPEYAPLLVLATRYELRRGDPATAAALLERARLAGAASAEIGALRAAFQQKFGREP